MSKKPQYGPEEIRYPDQHIVESPLVPEMEKRGYSKGFSAAITAASIGLSWLTGTANVTYGAGLGISGWVIDDNRCANSVIVVTLAAFSVFCAVKSDKLLINILVPALALLVLLSNGTKACYLAIYVIFTGFALHLVLSGYIYVNIVERLHAHPFQLRQWAQAESNTFFIFVKCTAVAQKTHHFKRLIYAHEN